MIAFQIVAIPLCLLLALAALRRRRTFTRRQSFFWVFLWLCAAVTIALPNLSSIVANWLGIGRGADLIVYSMAFAGILLARYFYVRQRGLESAITAIVRQQAIAGAAKRSNGSESIASSHSVHEGQAAP